MRVFGIQESSGYRVAYHLDQVVHCPGCGHRHWLVGRATAECAHCATALPIALGAASGVGVMAPHGGYRYEPALVA